MSEAVKKHPVVDILINFASLRSAFDTTMEAMSFKQVKLRCGGEGGGGKGENWMVCRIGGRAQGGGFRESLLECMCIQVLPLLGFAIIAEGIPENKTKLIKGTLANNF